MIETLRESLEAFHREREMEYYRALAGHQEALDIAGVIGRHAGLLAPPSLAALRDALASAADPAEKARLRKLLAELALSRLDQAVARESDAVVNAEGAAAVPLPGGGTVSFRNAPVARDNEPDRGKRRAISRAIEEVMEGTNPLREELHRKVHRAAAAEDPRGYIPLFESLTGIEPRRHRDDMDRLLADTDGVYRERMDAWLRTEVGVPLEEAEIHDVRHLARHQRFRALFPKERVVEMGVATMKGMGLDPTVGGRIVFDVEERPRKASRAFCSWVRVPDEVYLVILPSGGPDDAVAFLHEYGHAQHAANVRPGSPVEDARLGDNSVTEAYAMTFDHLSLDEAWLEEVAGLPDPGAFAREHALVNLFVLRRYAAKLAHEVALHGEGAGADLAAARRRYASLQGRAAGFAFPEAPYLFDVDPHFYAVRYVRAWHLEAVLSERLRAEFGERWFASPRAGTFLRELWAVGQREDAEEMARRLGAPGLDVSVLVRRATRPLV